MMRSSIGVPPLLVLAAALVAACTGSPVTTATLPATPTGTPAPAVVTPSPSPSPTPPADVAKSFTVKMVDPGFEGAGPISGTTSFGNLEGTVSGAIVVKGGDSSFQLAIEIPGLMSASAYQIKVDGKEYESQDGGPWFELEGTTDDGGLNAAMSVAALTVTDEGIVTKAGRSLHHLVPANGGSVTATDMGMTSPSMADAKGTLEFYAHDDGSLAVMSMSLSWTLTSGTTQVPATMAIDFIFDEGDGAVIVAPDQIWTRYTSTRFAYSIGYPADWELVEAASDSGWDLFSYSPAQYTAVTRDVLPESASGNLAAVVEAFVANQKKASKVSPETSTATSALGGNAWRLTHHRTVDGLDLYSVHTLIVLGQNAYQVSTVGPSGYEQELRDLHELQLTTMTLSS